MAETQVLAGIRAQGSAADTLTGGCFCGAVQIEAAVAPLEMGYCHCGSCRSYSGAPLTSFTLWRDDQIRIVTGSDLLGRFNKTDFSERRFCTRCGGHVLTEHPGHGLTDVYAAVFPTLVFPPTVHLNYAEAVLPVFDGLPKFKDFPAEAGGSGQRVPEAPAPRSRPSGRDELSAD